jgi:hypothetical protein
MIPLYDHFGFAVAWNWVHNVNSKCGGAYRPVAIAVRVRPKSKRLQLIVRLLPKFKRKVLSKVRRFAVSLVMRMLKMLRDNR